MFKNPQLKTLSPFFPSVQNLLFPDLLAQTDCSMDEEAAFLTDWQNHLAEALELIGRWHMPFGKYGPQHYPPKGVPLYDLPEEYVIWFQHNGFPKGRLGELLRIICELRMAGAEAVFEPLRRAAGGRYSLRPRRKKDYDFRDRELPLE